MEPALTALLLGAAPLTAIVGNRINWGRKPQSDANRPYIVLQRIDGVPTYHMTGASDHVASRVQADVYGETYTSTKRASSALIAVLSGYSGGIFQGMFLDSQRDFPAADAGEVTTLFRTSVDFLIHHQAS
ncbi:tail completion protein gp17 [Rhizobium sp. Root482]|uniref:tail completion protein gp17 n=1 Tax=Rhizobium sp. Root482 TaxID=1736543 RepID=UPI0006F59192|nr:DUF3168 domain-containing protein [Rhizobium sp. Root482]KQY27182.1 hypothetical protein ASD31_03075 [Rhizobium sp. Root482]